MVGKLWTQYVCTLLSYFMTFLFSFILFCRLTLWWWEMNLIGQFFLIGLPGCGSKIFLISFMSSFHELLLFFECKHNFLEFFPFSEIPMFEAAILAFKQKVKFFKIPPIQFLVHKKNASFVPSSKPLPRLEQFLYVSAVLKSVSKILLPRL